MTIKYETHNAETYNALGASFFEQGNISEAIAYFQHAIASCPDFGTAYYNLGVTLQSLGKFDEAITAYENAMRFLPDHALPYFTYVQCKKITLHDTELLEQLERITTLDHPDSDNRANALFALGKCYDDLGKFEKAFNYFSEANQLERRKYAFDPQELKALFDAEISYFSREFLENNKSLGVEDKTPIFIVGMPRSGTTLIEQILVKHSKIASQGELTFWLQQPSILPHDRQTPVTKNEISAIAKRFLEKLHSVSPPTDYVIDKLPGNFIRLGFIHLCFPQAHIIHCKRHPLDTCLSIFFHKLGAAHPYSYDLDDLAFYYSEYERLMAHWKITLPHQILEVNYENIIENQEIETKNILEFLDLEWETNCLNFHENTHSVRTASNWQVRQKLYTHAVNRWQNYRPYIAPLARCATFPDEV